VVPVLAGPGVAGAGDAAELHATRANSVVRQTIAKIVSLGINLIKNYSTDGIE